MPIYKLKDKQGYRVEVNYTDSFGIRKKLIRQNHNTMTLKDAKKVEMEMMQISSATVGTYTNYTFQKLLDYYEEVKKNEIKKTTLNLNMRRAKNYILPHFGKIKLSKINTRNLQEWKNDINKKNISTRYKNNIYKVFSAIMNFAVKYEILEKNPLAKLGGFKNPNEIVERKINFWTKEEFDKFCKVARLYCEKKEKEEDEDFLVYWGYYVAYNIMFYCGCRKGEIYPLNWTDYDGKAININKGLSYKNFEGIYIITSPKTKGSIRKISVPIQLKRVLDEHYERNVLACQFDDDSYFICGGVKPLTDTSLDDFKNKWAEEAGIKKIRIHDLRHSHASLLINKGVNIQVIAKRLGHSDIKMTLNTYSHLYKETEDKALDLLNSLD